MTQTQVVKTKRREAQTDLDLTTPSGKVLKF
jgi:hypothetical protein